MARIVTVTPNPAIDVTYSVDRQVIGETVRVAGVRRVAGGKGVNVARVLDAIGRDVSTLQPLGGAAGAWLERELVASGLHVHPCPIQGESRTTVAIVDGAAHPTLFAEPGPGLLPDEWSRLSGALTTAVGEGDWVVIAGSFPHGAAPGELPRLVQAAHSRGARVVVDTSGPFLLAAAEAGADVVKANEQEVSEATGGRDLRDALAHLARRGSTVVMSRGVHGALMMLPTGIVHEQSAVPAVRGNPTGAGDAATAGLVAALSEGHGAETALSWAAVCGAAAVSAPVAGEIDPTALADLASRLTGPAVPPLTPHTPERSPS
jgi:1-phosphofructokinase family hexose kinase